MNFSLLIFAWSTAPCRYITFSQIQTQLSRDQLSYPGINSPTRLSRHQLGSVIQGLTQLSRHQLSYPGIHSVIQASTQLSRHQLNYPGINSVIQASTQLSRHQLSYPGIKNLIYLGINSQVTHKHGLQTFPSQLGQRLGSGPATRNWVTHAVKYGKYCKVDALESDIINEADLDVNLFCKVLCGEDQLAELLICRAIPLCFPDKGQASSATNMDVVF